MAKYRLTSPEGETFEVTAPDEASPDDVMQYFQSQRAGQARAAAPQAVPEQVLSAGETAADVVKSAGIGVVQGGLGLATLPGNLEALGRAGIDAGARLVGVQDPRLSENNFLPTYTDAKDFAEQYTGEFYEPKTTLGKYARTAGEFAPMAIGGPATLGARAARVAAPAVASETAGQLTEGTNLEPWARAAGAIIGSRAPMPGAAPRVPANPQRAAAVQRLDQEGVNAMTAAQRTGNERMRWVEDATATVPGGGGRAVALQEQAARQFTSAALRRAGVQADTAEPAVLNTAFQNIGREFDQFARSYDVIGGPALQRRLTAIVRNYQNVTPQATRVPLIENVAQEMAGRATPALSGQSYAGIRSELRAAQRGMKNDHHATRAINEIVDSLDRALIRSAPQAQRRQILNNMRDMNQRYRNLLAIEDAAGAAGEAAATGLISPAALKNAVKKQNKRDYTRGRSELATLARAGETVLKPLKSSGTAERTLAQGYISTPGAVVGGLGGGSIEGALMGLVAPAAAKALTARAIMSRPGQAMIQNERVMNALADNQTLSRFAAPLLATHERGLRGGSGPSYDNPDDERPNRLR